jgi:hypothetical protein
MCLVTFLKLLQGCKIFSDFQEDLEKPFLTPMWLQRAFRCSRIALESAGMQAFLAKISIQVLAYTPTIQTSPLPTVKRELADLTMTQEKFKTK